MNAQPTRHSRAALRSLAVVALLLVAGPAVAEETLRFHGAPVEDERTGTVILGDREGGILAVMSARHGFGVVLPYAEDWTFVVGEAPLLRGSSGLVNLSVDSEPCDEPPRRHLEALKRRLQDSGRLKGLVKAELVDFKGEPALRVVQDARRATGAAEFEGATLVHLHGVKRRGETAFVVHLSRVIPAGTDAAPHERALRAFVTALRVDLPQLDR